MLTVIWNPLGFHLIDVLAKGCKFNAAYYATETLLPLSKWRSASAKGDKPKLTIHSDNSRPHTAQHSAQFFEQNRMKTAPHLRYSPDLAPCDFCPFGYVKGCLTDLSFESTDELLAAVHGVLEGIEKETLQAVLLEQMDQLRQYIASNGEHTDQTRIKSVEESSFIRTVLRCSPPGGDPLSRILRALKTVIHRALIFRVHRPRWTAEKALLIYQFGHWAFESPPQLALHYKWSMMGRTKESCFSRMWVPLFERNAAQSESKVLSISRHSSRYHFLSIRSDSEGCPIFSMIR
jgi:hypothetical protein